MSSLRKSTKQPASKSSKMPQLQDFHRTGLLEDILTPSPLLPTDDLEDLGFSGGGDGGNPSESFDDVVVEDLAGDAGGDDNSETLEAIDDADSDLDDGLDSTDLSSGGLNGEDLGDPITVITELDDEDLDGDDVDAAMTGDSETSEVAEETDAVETLGEVDQAEAIEAEETSEAVVTAVDVTSKVANDSESDSETRSDGNLELGVESATDADLNEDTLQVETQTESNVTTGEVLEADPSVEVTVESDPDTVAAGDDESIVDLTSEQLDDDGVSDAIAAQATDGEADDTEKSDSTQETVVEAAITKETLHEGHDHDRLPSAAPNFDSGIFQVEESGEVSVDFLYDGGSYKGELAIFSLEGMENYEPGSLEFMQEAARRSLSQSTLGHVVISDAKEAARFDGFLGESRTWNSGTYLGGKTYSMRPGDIFGLMLVPDGSIRAVVEGSNLTGARLPLFSLSTANPEDAFHIGQIADINGEGNAFSMEDKSVLLSSDRDYNDLIFQIRGARGKALLLDDVAKADTDWRLTTELGIEILNYITPQIDPDSTLAEQYLDHDYGHDHDHPTSSEEVGPYARSSTDSDNHHKDEEHFIEEELDSSGVEQDSPRVQDHPAESKPSEIYAGNAADINYSYSDEEHKLDNENHDHDIPHAFVGTEKNEESLLKEETPLNSPPDDGTDQVGASPPSEIPSVTTSNFDLKTLVSGNAWNGETITYSFLSNNAADSYYGNQEVSEVSNAVKANVRKIIEEVIESIIDVDFVEVSDSSNSHGQIRYMFSDDPSYAYAYYPSSSKLGGDIHLNSDFESDFGNKFSGYGNHGYMSLIHETFHALGLKHPGDYNGDGLGTGPFLPYNQDNTTNTVMTYNFTGSSAVTSMPYDIKALQDIYGAKANNAGSTIYSFNNVHSYHDGSHQSGNQTFSVKQTIWDSGDLDTLNFSGLGSDLAYRFDLNEGGILTTQTAFDALSYTARSDNSRNSYTTTRFGTSIAFGSIIENLVTSRGDDEVIANNASNTFSGYGSGQIVGDDVFRNTDSKDTLDLSAYYESEVTQSRVGNDLKIALKTLGTVTIAGYYNNSNRIQILWKDKPVLDTPSISISVKDAYASERSTGEIQDSASFTISRSGDLSKPTTVRYTLDGTAKNGADYSYLSGTVVIPAGQSSVPISISVLDDKWVEGTESVILKLSADSTYKLTGTTSASATIFDNDKQKPTISISASDKDASERKLGQLTDPGRFTITRTGSTNDSQVVKYTVSGSATNGLDYKSLSGSVVIPAGSSTVQIPISVFDDGLVEQGETVILTLQDDDDYQLSSYKAGSVTIYDNDLYSPSTITVTTLDSIASEKNWWETSDPAQFQINRSGGDNSKSETVYYTLTGTATNGTDYTYLSGVATIPAGATSTVVKVNPLDDSTYEGTENVTFSVSSNSNYKLGSVTQGNAWIYDNDVKPPSTITVTTLDSLASEKNWWETSDPAQFRINRSGGDNSKSETVYYTLTGTATNGTDYTYLSGVATIPAGATSTVVKVNPLDDSTHEGTENVTFSVSSNNNYKLGSVIQGSASILDNDAPDYEVAIKAEYQATKHLLGNSTSGYYNATTSPQGTTGIFQDYENGTIHWAKKYGAVAIWSDLQREYREYSSPNGSGGWLGFPTKREYPWGGGQRTDFEGGYIFWDGQRAKAYRHNELPVSHLIGKGSLAPQTFLDAYTKANGLAKGIVPDGNAYRWGNGWTQKFLDNEGREMLLMLEDGATEAFWITPKHFEEYMTQGGATGHLGYPRSNELSIPDKPSDWRYQVFATEDSRSRIHYSEQAGAVATWGQIGRRYTDIGGAYHWLGMPTRSEYLYGSDTIFSDFQGGKIAFQRSTGRVEVLRPSGTPSWLVWNQMTQVGFASRSPQIFRAAYNQADGLGKEFQPDGDAYRWGSGWTQKFLDNEGREMLLMLEDGATEAFWITPKHFEEYTTQGGATGNLGYPRSNELSIPDKPSDWRYQVFATEDSRSRIHYSEQAGAVATWGQIGRRYTDIGGAYHWLGMPTRSEYLYGSDTIFSDFQGGKIAFQPSTGRVEVLRPGQSPLWWGGYGVYVI